MHKRTSCCDWQKQQYFSQVHCVSGLSHCEHTVVKSASSGALEVQTRGNLPLLNYLLTNGRPMQDPATRSFGAGGSILRSFLVGAKQVAWNHAVQERETVLRYGGQTQVRAHDAQTTLERL